MANENNSNSNMETIIEEVEVKRTKKAADKKAESYKVAVPLLNIREKASLVAEIIGTLQEGDIVDISTRTPQGFGKLADDEGYIKLEFAQKIVNG